MIVREFVVLLSFTGYFTATNGLYLNFAAPKNKALESTHNTQDLSARNVGKLIRKGRHHHKKLVILDRKNKKVDDFVKQLLTVIEMNQGNKLLHKDHTLDHDRHKINCHLSFGSIYNAKAKRKRCKKLHPVFKRKQPWINFVIPIAVKKNVFSETMRQGFSEDYLIDFNRRTDIDFDYYNTAHRAQDNTFKHEKETADLKSKTVEVAAEKAEDVDAPPSSLRRDHTRFKIVANENSGELNYKRPEKSPTRSGDSASDGTDNSQDDEDKYNKNSDSSDGNSNDRKRRPMKKIKDEWNDIIKMPDTVPDSSEESSPPKKHKRIKNSSETNSDNEDRDDASTTENNDRNQYKNEDDGEKYVYMQGHRLYDTNLDKESRRMRIRDYFMPKRSYWSEDAINHLGPYWNSHEISGIHTR